MKEPQQKHASYLTGVFTPILRQEIIRKAVDKLTPHKHEFDFVAVSGVSGMMIGPSVADALGKQIIVVRKPKKDFDYGCQTHSEFDLVEGLPYRSLDSLKFLVLDDFRSRGTTFRRICHSIYKCSPDLDLDLFGFYGYKWGELELVGNGWLTRADYLKKKQESATTATTAKTAGEDIKAGQIVQLGGMNTYYISDWDPKYLTHPTKETA